ncbi:MAG: hypothetical protein ABIS23_04410 [Sphingomicrobium sp.]
MSELIFLGIIVGLGIIAGWLTAHGLIRRASNWPKRRIVNVAALVLPAVVWIFCVVLVAFELSATPEECGVDACGMVIASAMFLVVAAFLMFGCGLLGAELACRQTLRNGMHDVTEDPS